MSRGSGVRTRLAGWLLAGAMAAAFAGPAHGAVIAQRTLLVSDPQTTGANGASANPSLHSATGAVVFDSAASNLGPADGNGAVRDVYGYAIADGRRVLVSQTPDGSPARGPSTDPVLAGSGLRLAFVSQAANLVPGDGNGVADILLAGGGPLLERVSVGARGEANGPSTEPDLSFGGNVAVFTSRASNLVAGDTNNAADVFVRDLRNGTTRRVSVGPGGIQGNGPSTSPAISADANSVTFYSRATNLVPRDRNGRPDVFLFDLRTGQTERISISTAGTAQNAAVAAPFAQVSDVSGNGRYVVFDSDATNLAPRDTNRDTDVFLRDRRLRRTQRISVDSSGRQSDNDSFAPAMTPAGSYVTFQSFANNLAPGGSPRDDIFVRDLRLRATSVASVGSTGQSAAVPSGRQLLQQAAIADDGRAVAFASLAPNLVGNDRNGLDDLFLRRMDPPETRALRVPGVTRLLQPTASYSADEPQTRTLLCRLDRFPQGLCTLRFRFGRLSSARHVLSVRAGGPGLLFDPTPVVTRFAVDRSGPVVRVTSPRFSLRPRTSVTRIAGSAIDPGFGVRRVEVWAAAVTPRGCVVFDGRRWKPDPCRTPLYLPATGTGRWSFALPGLKPAFLGIRVRAVDRAGNRGRTLTGNYVVL